MTSSPQPFPMRGFAEDAAILTIKEINCMKSPFKGHLTVITGASGGIGYAYSQSVSSDGL